MVQQRCSGGIISASCSRAYQNELLQFHHDDQTASRAIDLAWSRDLSNFVCVLDASRPAVHCAMQNRAPNKPSSTWKTQRSRFSIRTDQLHNARLFQDRRRRPVFRSLLPFQFNSSCHRTSWCLFWPIIPAQHLAFFALILLLSLPR